MREGGGCMVLRKSKIEIWNSGLHKGGLRDAMQICIENDVQDIRDIRDCDCALVTNFEGSLLKRCAQNDGEAQSQFRALSYLTLEEQIWNFPGNMRYSLFNSIWNTISTLMASNQRP
jgi:hypothetical protein